MVPVHRNEACARLLTRRRGSVKSRPVASAVVQMIENWDLMICVSPIRTVITADHHFLQDQT